MNKASFYIIAAAFLTVATSCDNSNNRKSSSYQSEITMDEDLNITDFGRSGETTPDGNYYYHGSVTLYSEDGDSRTFDCYEGTKGREQGCRGVLHNGKFHNLDRNEWITINGVRYSTSDS